MKLLEIIGPGVVARGDYPVPEKIQKWIPWMTKTVQHAQAQLSNDRVLSQKNKQNFRSLTKKASDKVQTPDDDTPVWGRILFISTALMMIVNKISAAAGAMAVALADKDGDGDLDFDDFNELMPEQIDRYQEIHTKAKEFVKSPEFQRLNLQDQQKFIDHVEYIDDKLNNNIVYHTIDNAPELKDFHSNSEPLDYNLLVNHIYGKEAIPFDAERAELAHSKYGSDIDKVKLSDDSLAVYKMYDTAGNYRVYLDSLERPTVGIGHLIDKYSPESVKNLKVGDTISPEQGKQLFYSDVKDAIQGVEKAIQDHPKLQNVEFEALVDVQFQMGNKVWNDFDETMKLIDAGDYLGASKEALRSQWAEQTPSRAKAFSDALVNTWKGIPSQADIQSLQTTR